LNPEQYQVYLNHKHCRLRRSRSSFSVNMTIASKSYVFDPRPNYPLLVTAKHYWTTDSPYLDNPDAVTLIFTHGTGFHKEQWEPTIGDLFALLATNNGSVKVREMWSIDGPNHGDSAVLNEKALKFGYESVCMCFIVRIYQISLFHIHSNSLLGGVWPRYSRFSHRIRNWCRGGL
jgi:hypothetical protein